MNDHRERAQCDPLPLPTACTRPGPVGRARCTVPLGLLALPCRLASQIWQFRRFFFPKITKLVRILLGIKISKKSKRFESIWRVHGGRIGWKLWGIFDKLRDAITSKFSMMTPLDPDVIVKLRTRAFQLYKYEQQRAHTELNILRWKCAPRLSSKLDNGTEAGVRALSSKLDNGTQRVNCEQFSVFLCF